ncbi:hypothetical protein JSY14_09910 [Brachybacterium sp. EF45031]|nr:hypothetical protein [Brachybacterium sillae]
MLLGACTTPGTQGPGAQDPAAAPTDPARSETSAAPSGSAAPSAAVDPATREACAELWGDPDYRAPLTRDILDRAATARENGPDDPMFYAMTGDDIEAAVASAPPALQQAAAPLATWMREQPQRGAAADMDAFDAAYAQLADACAPASPAAQWAAAPGADATKPATLVCADVFDTPLTRTDLRSANVLTSELFQLVGRSPRTVPDGREDQLRVVDTVLTEEIRAVDDDAVRKALLDIRTPVADALGGDLDSPGIAAPLEDLTAACTAAGYATGSGQEPSGGDEGGLV